MQWLGTLGWSSTQTSIAWYFLNTTQHMYINNYSGNCYRQSSPQTPTPWHSFITTLISLCPVLCTLALNSAAPQFSAYPPAWCELKLSLHQLKDHSCRSETMAMALHCWGGPLSVSVINDCVKFFGRSCALSTLDVNPIWSCILSSVLKCVVDGTVTFFLLGVFSHIHST
jgi:hypothetical protein